MVDVAAPETTGSIAGAHVVVELERIFDAPLADVWAATADTDRLNRTAGMPPIELMPVERDESGVRVRARVSVLGIPSTYEAPLPYVRAPFAFAFDRSFDSGPVERYVLEFSFEAIDVERTRVTLRFRALARSVLRYAAPVLKLGAERDMRTLLASIGERLQDRATGPVAAPTTGAADDRVERLAAPLRRQFEERLVDGLEALIVSGDDLDVAALRPRALAARWGADEARTLSFLFAAVDAGLLRLRWALLCPSCRVPAVESDDLGSVGTGEQHCEICAIDFGAELDQNVEVLFVPDPAVRALPRQRWCTGGPAMMPHVVLQDGDVRHGRVVHWVLPTAPQRYRVFASGGRVAQVVIAEGGVASGRVDVPPEGTPPTYTFAPGAEVEVHVPEGFRGFLRLEEERWRRSAITARELFLMPAARSRVVPGTLRRNAQLSLGRLAVLLSDLSGSTAYYESAGDAEACAFVLEHFEIVRAVIESTGGVLLKTIGDAVLALYSDEEVAAVGALRIARAVRRHLAERGRLADLGLKLAVHGGTGFLVREGDRLDVYGRTVNRAARLESQASQGEIVFEASAFDALPTRVQDRFTVARRFAFEAKGVTTAMRAVACLARPEAT